MPSTKFSQLLNKYQTALETLKNAQPLPSENLILVVLQARDQLQVLLADKTEESPQEIFQLIELDEQLRKQREKINKVIDIKIWRGSVLPSDSAWWWFLDESIDKNRRQIEVVRNIVTGTLMVFVISITIEIIQRFWTNTSDTISVAGTLLILLFTASPFIKQGQEVSEWLLKQLPFIKPRNISDIRIFSAILALGTLLVFRLWILPGPLATYYNNYGLKVREAGNLNKAQQMFQRAAALNPDRVVPYQNIADAYKELGFEDQAIEWYQKAIERDVNFAPAYRGLGEVYNRKGEFLQSEAVLLASLSLEPGYANETVEKITKYELLSNLGWSYWGQNKTDLARSTLEAALSLETDLKKIGDSQGVEYRLALPHFYLAQTYEQLDEKKLALQQWEESLRFLDEADWYQRERYFIAQQHLELLTK